MPNDGAGIAPSRTQAGCEHTEDCGSRASAVAGQRREFGLVVPHPSDLAGHQSNASSAASAIAIPPLGPEC